MNIVFIGFGMLTSQSKETSVIITVKHKQPFSKIKSNLKDRFLHCILYLFYISGFVKATRRWKQRGPTVYTFFVWAILKHAIKRRFKSSVNWEDVHAADRANGQWHDNTRIWQKADSDPRCFPFSLDSSL